VTESEGNTHKQNQK